MSKSMIAPTVAVLIGLAMVARTVLSEPRSAAPHRVVFEITQESPDQWQGALNNVENAQKAFGPDAIQIEVVNHGKSLGMLLKTNTALQDRLEKLSKSGVTFAACENTMRRNKVQKQDLLPFATTVDSGVAELIRKQESNWSYIKTGE